MTDERTLPEGIYRDAYGFYVRVKIGSGKTPYRDQQRFPATATTEQMVGWRDRTRARLETQRTKDQADAPPVGTLEASLETYFADAILSPTTRKRRRQQLDWWCAQPAALGAPTFSVDELAAKPQLFKRAGRLGLVPRTQVEPKRIRQILAAAFKPTGDDPAEFANTSNHYRTALLNLYSVLDVDDSKAVNPIEKVEMRPAPEPRKSGLDMRIVVEILQHLPSRFGRSGRVSELRIAALAWNHITPVQLQRFDPARDFHDLANATREEILDGAITMDLPARLKGRLKTIPAPQTIPCNPWGAEAMRALAAEPTAWVKPKFSLPPLNKIIKRACVRAQAALAARGIHVDLSGVTLYHLKHSLSTAAQLASPGVLDDQGRIKPAPGLQAALHHAKGRTTRFYTEAAVDPLVRLTNAQTTLYLEALFREPLRSGTALRLVAARAAGE
jgi:hypothetical protein